MSEYPNINHQSYDPLENEDTFSLIHHPHKHHLEDDELIAVIDPQDDHNSYGVSDPVTPREKQVWEQLATPWGMGALFVFLLANTLLSWIQWSNYQQSSDTVSVYNDSVSELSPPNSNLATVQGEKNLTLDKLSTFVPIKSPVNVPKSVVPISQNKIVSKPPTAPKPVTNNLTNAMLPPSLQPQFIPVTVPVTSAPSLSQSLTPVSPPITPVTVPTQPVVMTPPPAPTQPLAISTPPAPSSSQRNIELNRQMISDQMRIREQEQISQGANNQTGLTPRSPQNQQDTSALVEQLQQLNQQKVDESKPTNSP